MREAFDDVARLAEAIATGIDKGPIVPDVAPEEIRTHLHSRFDFSRPMPLSDVLDETVSLLHRWQVQVTHPRYFGLFNPSVTVPSVIADFLVAAYNPQLAAWSHSPAANEIEHFTLAWLTEQFGLDPDSSFANFTTGGAEANLSALLIALARSFPAYAKAGARGITARPLVYLSDEGHHSFVKSVQMTGLGLDALRTIRTTTEGQMDVDELRRRIRTDRKAGDAPLFVVGTVGTTSTGIIDPLPELARVCREEGLWFHVDAAWGGAAVLSPRLKPHLAGIEAADSITCDAHKWFSVPMAAGMLFCRHQEVMRAAFDIRTSYMPPTVGGDAPDPFATTVQWSRRFIGLKLFLSLAHLGRPGYVEMIERQTALGDYLRSALKRTGWTIVNRTPLPLVCFTRDGLDVEHFLQQLYRRQIAWMSEISFRGRPAVRACITSFRTSEEDIDHVVTELDNI